MYLLCRLILYIRESSYLAKQKHVVVARSNVEVEYRYRVTCLTEFVSLYVFLFLELLGIFDDGPMRFTVNL